MDTDLIIIYVSDSNSWTVDRNGPCMSRGSIILWIRKEEPSGGGVDGSRRRLGGREDRERWRERIGAEVSHVFHTWGIVPGYTIHT